MIPIIFFGAGSYVLPIIELLHKNYDLKLVVTTEQKTKDPVPSYCQAKNIPFLSVKTLKDEQIIQQLKSLQAPVAVLAYFGFIVSQKIIDIFPKGIVNIHPSLLPKYRGTTPGQTTILNGDKTTGVSIMLLDKGVDHGPILAQQVYQLSPEETADTFYQQIFQAGTKLLATVLDKYIADEVEPTPQDHEKATFTKMLTKQDGFIDAEKAIDKEALQRMIRAYYPWPGVWTRMKIKSQEARIKFLPDKNIQVEGKKPMTIKDFLNGYPEAKEWLEKFI